jgi:hypothetical protein
VDSSFMGFIRKGAAHCSQSILKSAP